MSDNEGMRDARGSVLWFVLLGIILLAALSYAISQTSRIGSSVGGDERAELAATNVQDFVRAIEFAVRQMRVDGIPQDQISFLRPGDAGFDTAPHNAKVFHPEGGAVNYTPVWKDLDDPAQATATSWAYTRNAVEGVGTTEKDLLVTLRYVPKEICAKLNEKINGSDVIPTIAADHFELFANPGTTTPVSAANCPSCEKKKMLCVGSTLDSTVRTFYAVVDTR